MCTEASGASPQHPVNYDACREGCVTPLQLQNDHGENATARSQQPITLYDQQSLNSLLSIQIVLFADVQHENKTKKNMVFAKMRGSPIPTCVSENLCVMHGQTMKRHSSYDQDRSGGGLGRMSSTEPTSPEAVVSCSPTNRQKQTFTTKGAVLRDRMHTLVATRGIPSLSQ